MINSTEETEVRNIRGSSTESSHEAKAHTCFSCPMSFPHSAIPPPGEFAFDLTHTLAKKRKNSFQVACFYYPTNRITALEFHNKKIFKQQ